MNLSNQKGTALTELAIALLFLIPLVFGLIDFSIMISNYQKLEQAVREGVRTATRVQGLTSHFCFEEHDLIDTNPSNDINSDYCRNNRVTNNDATLDCFHAWVQARVRQVIRYQRLFNFSSTEPVQTNGFENDFHFFFIQTSF